MLHFIIGGAGCGKSYRLMELIEKYAAESRDVLALVPEQFSYEFDRKLYDRLGAEIFNSLETHSFTSLARGIFQRFGGGEAGSYMDELMQTGLVLKAVGLAEGQLRFFHKQCARGEFSSEVSAVISLLRRSGITSEQLLTQCQGLKGRLLDKTIDIALIYQQYETLLAKHHLKDMLTDITEAAAIANGNDYFAGKIIFIDEFESFTPDQYEMLSVMIGLADEVYIAFRMESENEHELSLFASVGAACRKIRHMAADYHVDTEFIHCKEQHRMKYRCMQRLSEAVFRPVIGERIGISEHIHVFEAASPSDETEYVCATIKRLLANDPSLRLRDIAVVTNELPVYAGMLAHSMERYGLPCHIDMAKPLLHTPFMVYLTSLMALLEKKSPDTELLLRCGKSGFTDLTLLELSELENYCYIWSIDGNMWNEPFTCGKDAELAEDLRQKLLSPLCQLRDMCKSCVTGADYSRAVYEFLMMQETGRRADALLTSNDEGILMQMKQDFRRVWDSLMDILDVLAFLYEEQKCTAKEYFMQLGAMLKTVSHSVPPRTLDAVFAGPAGTSRLSQPKVTFVLGACEGIFPKNAAGSLLFSERDRLELESCGIDIGQPPELSAADERLAVYKILSSASEELYLCYPLKDSGDSKRIRSSVVSLALSLFENENEMLTTQHQLGASYYAVTKAAAYYHYVQDFSKRNADIAAVQTILYEDEYYAQRIDYLRSVHKDIDFTVAPVLMEQLVGSSLVLSASQIETFRMCPFQYFCKYAMRLYERRKIKLQAAESGSLVHACLEELIRNTPRDVFLSMTKEDIKSALDRISEKYWNEVFGGNNHQSQRDIAAFMHVTEGTAALAMHMQEELSQSEFYPEFLEADISDKSTDFPSPKLMTASGHLITIRGKVDRIDVFHDTDADWVRVVDYKTGGKKFALGNLAYGLDMQMLLYLFAVTGEGTKLSNGNPAGVLYLPSGGPECSAERGSGESVEDTLRKQYRMNGLMLDDKKVLGAMDKSLSGTYITAKLVKTGTAFDKRSGSFLSEKQFESLRTYTENKVKETAEAIYSGDTAVDPLILSDREACKFCTYRDVCGNGDLHKCRIPSETASELKERVMKELE